MSGTERFTLRAAIYLLLIKDGQVLLLRRQNTGWRDGEYSLVSGHLDRGESVVTAMVREAKEEAGISILERDLKFAHVMQQYDNNEYVDFYFTADRWTGVPENKEPNFCDDMRWFDLKQLPQKLVPNVAQAIDLFKQGVYFSVFEAHQ
jgi:8-oxo-dGTP diphosphatase